MSQTQTRSPAGGTEGSEREKAEERGSSATGIAPVASASGLPSGRLGQLRAYASKVPGPLVGLIVIVIVLALASKSFLTVGNIGDILDQSSAIGVMAVGEMLVILVAGIDLSVASILAVSAMIGASLFSLHGIPWALGIFICLAVGVVMGLINGLISVYWRIQPFIVTLAMNFAGAGIALLVTNGTPVSGLPSWFTTIAKPSIFGFLSVQVILMIVAFVIAALWLRFRPLGRGLYAVGGNSEVARLSGLPVNRARVLVYVVSGFLAAVAGLFVAAQLASAEPTVGSSDLLDVIAAVVIGGASLMGGTGSMSSTFIGVLIIGVITNGLDVLNVSPNLEPAVIGAVIIIAVLTDRNRRAS